MSGELNNKLNKIVEYLKENIKACNSSSLGIAFSGGVDSTTIAKIAKDVDLNPTLITVVSERHSSEDEEMSKKMAKALNLRHKIIKMNEESTVKTYEMLKAIMPNVAKNFVKADVLVPIVYMTYKIKDEIDVMLYGAATEELFAGYNRHFSWIDEGLPWDEINKRLLKEYIALGREEGDIWAISKISQHFNVKACFPFYDERIKDIAFSIDVRKRMSERELKKPIIREIAKIVGVPEEAINRKKKALQYGTKVHNIMIRLKRKGLLKDADDTDE